MKTLPSRRALHAIQSGTLLVLPGLPTVHTAAQPSAKVRRVGVLSAYSGPLSAQAEFGRALGELGYVEGKNLVIENRLGSALFVDHHAQLIQLIAASRLPAIYSGPDFAEAGGLMSYGASFSDAFHRAALYVDKVLKGAKPGDLPIQQPTRFELVINLKTAKTLGLTIPDSLLVRADKVIR